MALNSGSDILPSCTLDATPAGPVLYQSFILSFLS